MPKVEECCRYTQRPWVGTCFFGFEEPVENMPQYGREYGRVVGLSSLLLCRDLEPAQKEPLLVDLVQVGIDLGGMVRAGHPGWTAWGGHGSGRTLTTFRAGFALNICSCFVKGLIPLWAGSSIQLSTRLYRGPQRSQELPEHSTNDCR
jgi:hypothetical protein